MKLSKLLLASVISFSTTPVVYAETTRVFCAIPDGSDWYWLRDLNKPLIRVGRAGYSYSPLVISGEWESSRVGTSPSRYFSITEADYLLIKNKCRSGYVVQPADSTLDYWSVYKVYLPSGQHFIAPGYEFNNSESWRKLQGMWSDIRLKQDIQPLQDSLDKISHVGGYSYSWRPDSTQGHKAGQYEYGVIAQEIQAEFPELVKQDDQGFLRVNYRGLIPVLLESIKELKARLEALEAQH